MIDRLDFDLIKKIYIFIMIHEGYDTPYIMNVTGLKPSQIIENICHLEKHLGFNLFIKKSGKLESTQLANEYYRVISEKIKIDSPKK